MSNSKSAKKAASALRLIHGTGNPKAASLEDLQGVLKTMRVARQNGIDMRVQLHVGATTVDVSNGASEPAAIAAAAEVRRTPALRFVKVGADGHALPATAKEWDGVYDARTELIWGRKLLSGEHTWADAQTVAAKATLCGQPARAPTIQERLSIVDYTRIDPAIDVEFFDPKETSGWEWTSTAARAPSGVAWGVGLGYGGSGRDDRGGRDRVRAVRAGQPLGFSF